MKVNSNIQGMIAQGILSKNEAKFSKSTQKLSSGYMINRAMDNPAGMAITNKMNAQLRSLDRATKNANNAKNVCQIADGALSEIEAMLQRMNELSIKSSTGTLTDADRDAIHEEVTQLCNEITRISKDTEYNTKGILDGSQDLKGYSSRPNISVRSYNTDFDLGEYQLVFGNQTTNPTVHLNLNGNDVIQSKEITDYYDDNHDVIGRSIKITTRNGGEIIIDSNMSAGIVPGVVDLDISGIGGMKIQVGAESRQEIQVVIPTISLKHMGLGDLNDKQMIDCRTQESSREAIGMVSKAIDYISQARSKIGAYQNRIENTISNLNVTYENLTESYSTIKDLDMAEGMVEYTQLQVLVQAGTSMLAQANEQPQQALQLLQ